MRTRKIIQFIALVCLVGLICCTTQTKRGKTIQNIRLGIETETTASLKYAAYSQKAWVEGLDTIAKLFAAASKAEAIHASNHASVLKTFKADMYDFVPKFSVRTTAENLQEAITDETYEVNTMYPMFLKDAKSKSIKKATIESLTWAFETEKKHVVLFKKALEALKTNSEKNLAFEYKICPVCGNTFDSSSVPDTCELCGDSHLLFLDVK